MGLSSNEGARLLNRLHAREGVSSGREKDGVLAALGIHAAAQAAAQTITEHAVRSAW